MAIRKRSWKGPSGEPKQAWQADYRDAQGIRRSKQFARKREAEEFLSRAGHEVRQGTHTADSQSITVERAAQLWLARAAREGLEPSTIAAYGQHVRLHITPYLGARKLNQLTKPIVEAYRDQLIDEGRSRAMVARVLRSLSAIVSEAERVGAVAQNVCRGITVRRATREKAKVVPPTKAELRALLAQAEHARPMDKPLLMILIFAGLRASEARALPWRNVDLDRGTITIDQRADYQNTIAAPKSAAGRRTIPVPPTVVSELRRWKLRCPPSALDLVFPSSEGTPIFHPNLV